MGGNSYSTVAPRINFPDLSSLRGLDTSRLVENQWDAVFDALTFAIAGIQGIQQQPRCGQDHILNPAGEYLDLMVDFLNEEKTRLIRNLKAHKPTDAENKQRRASLLIRYEAECGELSMPEMAAYALSLSKNTN